MASRDEPRSKLARVARTILFALAFAFLFGFIFGTVLRQKVDRPTRYIGALPAGPHGPQKSNALALCPSDVRDARSRIFMPRDDEKQIG